MKVKGERVMAKHQAQPAERAPRRITRFVWHPAVHLLALIGLHVLALAILGLAKTLPMVSTLVSH